MLPKRYIPVRVHVNVAAAKKLYFGKKHVDDTKQAAWRHVIVFQALVVSAFFASVKLQNRYVD